MAVDTCAVFGVGTPVSSDWGNKWGNMPHRFQPIRAGCESPETA